jgi:predicted RNase H-like HicB family nuclease
MGMNDDLMDNEEKVTIYNWEVTFHVSVEIPACASFKPVKVEGAATREEAIERAKVLLKKKLKDETEIKPGQKSIRYSSYDYIDEVEASDSPSDAFDQAKSAIMGDYFEEIDAEEQDDGKEVVRVKPIEDHPDQLRMML